jgi:hypothetical protein
MGHLDYARVRPCFGDRLLYCRQVAASSSARRSKLNSVGEPDVVQTGSASPAGPSASFFQLVIQPVTIGSIAGTDSCGPRFLKPSVGRGNRIAGLRSFRDVRRRSHDLVDVVLQARGQRHTHVWHGTRIGPRHRAHRYRGANWGRRPSRQASQR